MVIDKNPIIDIPNRTFIVQYNISEQEDVSILVNGLVSFFNTDIESITDNKIKLKSDSSIDWGYDSFVVFYTER